MFADKTINVCELVNSMYASMTVQRTYCRMTTRDACLDTGCPEDSGLACTLCMVDGSGPGQSDIHAARSR
jgi:hypothetical protein